MNSKADRPWKAGLNVNQLASLLYPLGRMVAYLGLAFVLVNTMLSVPQMSMFLQKYMHMRVVGIDMTVRYVFLA